MAQKKAPHPNLQPSEMVQSQLIETNGMAQLFCRENVLAQYRDGILNLHQQIIASEIDRLGRHIACGWMLTDVSAMIPHGGWKKWLRENFSASTGLSERTAQRYMRAATDYRRFLVDFGYASLDDVATQTQLNLEYIQEFHANASGDSAGNKKEPVGPNDWLTPSHVIEAVRGVLGAIECDPCAASSETASLAEIQYSKNEDGLADANPWPGTVWIAPGHMGDLTPWCVKALRELASGNLSEAIVWLPESAVNLVPELLRFPIAVTSSPLVVSLATSRGTVQKPLPTRSLFVYLTGNPTVELFAKAFRDIAVAFAPVNAAADKTSDALGQ